MNDIEVLGIYMIMLLIYIWVYVLDKKVWLLVKEINSLKEQLIKEKENEEKS